MCTPLLNLHADFDFSMRGLIHLRESINSFESTLSLEAINITGIYSSRDSRSNVTNPMFMFRAIYAGNCLQAYVHRMSFIY